MIADETPEWAADGACVGVDPDLFFPGRGESTGEARAICAECPVIDECRDYGLFEKFGIWGGLSERERRRIRRGMRRSAA